MHVRRFFRWRTNVLCVVENRYIRYFNIWLGVFKTKQFKTRKNVSGNRSKEYKPGYAKKIQNWTLNCSNDNRNWLKIIQNSCCGTYQPRTTNDIVRGVIKESLMAWNFFEELTMLHWPYFEVFFTREVLCEFEWKIRDPITVINRRKGRNGYYFFLLLDQS